METNEGQGLRLSGLTDAERDDDDPLVRWVEARLLLAARAGAANPGRPYTIGQLRHAAREFLAKVRPSPDRIPVHQGEVLLGYATFRLDGQLELTPELPSPPLGGRPAHEARPASSDEAVAAARNPLLGTLYLHESIDFSRELVARFEAAVRTEAVAGERQRIRAAVADVHREPHWLERGHDDGYRDAVSRCVAAVGSVPVPTEQSPICSTCDDVGVIRQQQEIGAPGTGGWVTCPDCHPYPPEPAEQPEGR